MTSPAQKKIIPQLSAYVDGELTPQERQEVESHLVNHKESSMLVADLRAGDGLMRSALEIAADEVDWRDFTNQVMSKVTPEKLPVFDRMQLFFSETLTYQRGPMIGTFVGAAAAIVIAVPLALTYGNHHNQGYENSRVEVQTVSIDSDSPIRPVVMETESGDAVIWMVEVKEGDGGKKKKSGEENEEEVIPKAPPEKKGDL